MRIVLISIIICGHFSFCQTGTARNAENNERLLKERFQFLYTDLFVQKLANLIPQSSPPEVANSWYDDDNNQVQPKKLLDTQDESIAGGYEAGGKAKNKDESRLRNRLNQQLDSEEDSFPAGQRLPSRTCQNHTLRIITGVLNREKWALQMIDAFGKPGSDLMRGNLGWLGSFDECLDVTTSDVDFRSTYCKAVLAKPPDSNQSTQAIPLTQSQSVSLGMCVPDSCSNSDVTNIVISVLAKTNISLYPVVTCYQRDYRLDTPAKVALAICAVFVFLVIIGTGCDVIYAQRKKDADPPDAKQTLLGLQLLMSFSVYTNGAKILNTYQTPGSLTAVHGIRFLSISWVVLGHTYSTLPAFGTNLGPYFQEHTKRWEFSPILNGLLSVDSFFTLSGLLVSYLTLRELMKGEGKLNWFMFYFHRFWRLTPVYMMMLMVYDCLYQYIGDGPLWFQKGIQKDICRDNWWTNLLYINNLVHRDEQCFAWAWYLANDMQFYILSPIILVPLFHSVRIGLVILGVFLIATLTTAGLISRLNNLPAGFLYLVEGTPGPDTYKDYYMTPYCRMGPYLVGIMAGYILFKNNGQLQMSKSKVVLCWTFAIASALAVVYGPYESANGTPMPSNIGALYNAVHRTVWGVAVSWVVVACATGHGGFVNTLLSWSGFVPASRLTYCIYLIHPLVLTLLYSSQRSLIYMNDVIITFNVLGILTATLGLALVVSLIFEAPVMGLERALLKRERRN